MNEQNEPFIQESDYNDIPPRTNYDTIFSFLGIQLNYIPSTKKYYLNHWEIHLFYPISVLYVIFSSYIVILKCIYPNVDWLNRKILIPLTIFMILFSYSYLSVILVGPGYLPYYYPMRFNGDKDNDYLSGIVTTKEQQNYLQKKKYPTRVRYFRSVQRLVIRPDHLCAWVSSFIGKKNHKLFFLFNMWGVLYISLFNYCIIRGFFTIVVLLQTENRIILFIIVIIYIILGLSFLFLTGNFTQQNIRHISENRTQLEIMKGENPNQYRKDSIISNWEEVFGSIKQWYLWLIPIPAFYKLDDYSLSIEDFRFKN